MSHRNPSSCDALPARHNMLSDLVRNPAGRVAQRIALVGEANVCTSVIVTAELRYGAFKKGSDRLTSQLEAILRALEILPFDAPADAGYGRLRVRKRGGEGRGVAVR